MLGEQGNERDFVDDFIAGKKLKNIRIDKPTDKISQYYEESAILMMTSVFEGFPLVLAEAMSRGCVPIAFESFSSIHDIIEPEQNGILVTPFNIEEFVCKLNALVTDDEKRQMLSYNAIKVANRFDLDTIGSQWVDMFCNLSQQIQ